MSDKPVIKPLVCPHGSSLPCSQCIGADVRKVVFIEGKGMFVDGKLERSGLLPQKEIDALKETQVMRSKRGHEARRDAVCGVCGEHGHTRKTCYRRSKLLSEAPIAESEVELRPKGRGSYRCTNCYEVGHNIQTCPIKNAA